MINERNISNGVPLFENIFFTKSICNIEGIVAEIGEAIVTTTNKCIIDVVPSNELGRKLI